MCNRKVSLEFLIVIILFIGCKKTEQPIIIGTTVVTQITASSAKCGGFITSGIASVHGVCWSTHSSPTISDSLTRDGSGAGAYISKLNELKPKHLYYVRSYGTNSQGTIYGNEYSFTTLGESPAVVTNRPIFVANTEAIIAGIVRSNLLRTDIYFEYGLDSSYGSEVIASPSYLLRSDDTTNVTANVTARDIIFARIFNLSLQNSSRELSRKDLWQRY